MSQFAYGTWKGLLSHAGGSCSRMSKSALTCVETPWAKRRNGDNHVKPLIPFLVALFAFAAPALAADTLNIGGELKPGERLRSQNDRFFVLFQPNDGNVVVYERVSMGNLDRKALWSTRTEGKDAARFWLQPDGNLVVYDKSGKAIWSPNIHGQGGTRLVMQDDGNLVVYTAAGKPVWATNTVQPPVASIITPPPVSVDPNPGVSEAHCTIYANEAVKLAVKQDVLNMGFIGPRWSQSFKEHFDFCRGGAPVAVLLAEHNARVDAIRAKHASQNQDDRLLELLEASIGLILQTIAAQQN